MKLFPTKDQWNKWTLPSKASYAGFMIGVFSIILTIIIFTFSNDSDKNFGQPQIAINYSSKPYLRYTNISPSGFEFSYEICVKNTGQNPTSEMVYAKLVQTLVVGTHTVKRTEGKETKNPLPKRLVSGDKYCQIFRMYNANMTTDQINNCLKKYKENELAIILEIVIQYEDAITGEVYSITERNKIFKDKVMILN